MRKKTLGMFFVLWAGICVFLLSGTPRAGAVALHEYGYRIRYQNCAVAAAADQSLEIGSQGADSSVKIQYLKKLPEDLSFDIHDISTNAPAGTLYLRFTQKIPKVLVHGAMGKFYTEAKIDQFLVDGVLSSFTAKNTWAGTLLTNGTFGSVKMSAQANSGYWEYATTVLQAIGSSAYSPMSIQTTGVVFEQVSSLAPIGLFKVASKKGRAGTPPQSCISVGGLGRVTPAARANTGGSYACAATRIEQLDVSGAYMELDELLSLEPIEKIRAVSVNFGGMSLGGIVGLNDTASDMIVDAPSIGTIYGQVAVKGAFWVPQTAQASTAFHEGTIGSISTGKKGLFWGIAHVAPSCTIKFTPAAHPDFWVCNDPSSHQP